MSFRSDKQRKAAMARLNKGAQHPSRQRRVRAAAADLSLSQLQAVNAQRPFGSLMLDLSLQHRKQIEPGSKSVAGWLRRPGKSDVIGVDNAGAILVLLEGKKMPSMARSPLDGEQVHVKVPAEKSTRVQMPPKMREVRTKNMAALKEVAAAADAEIKMLNARMGGVDAKDKAVLRKQVKALEHRRTNAKAQMDAYRGGYFLVVGAKKDEKLVRDHALLLKDSFEVHPKAMATSTVVVGSTNEPGLMGYTHAMRDGNYEADYVGMQEKVVGDNHPDKPIESPQNRKRRLTHIHEQVHIQRSREATRKHLSMVGVDNYGRDADKEEKETVLETNLRGAPVGEKSTEGYYSFINADNKRRGLDPLPNRVGDQDNMTAMEVNAPRRIKKNVEIKKGMARVGKTHIGRLQKRKGEAWGGIPPEAENVDRVFQVDGRPVHTYDPAGKGPRPESLRGGVGLKDAEVEEFKDGKVAAVKPRPRIKGPVKPVKPRIVDGPRKVDAPRPKRVSPGRSRAEENLQGAARTVARHRSKAKHPNGKSLFKRRK